MADRDASPRSAWRARSARGERIAVFGDYDCDGITAAAIMTRSSARSAAEVVPLLASRFDGGYGLSAAALDARLASGARLLVTCDCGSSRPRAARSASRARHRRVVIDHHLVPDEPLPALAFLNPHRPECGFPYKGLASCGLALSVGAALRTALGTELDLRRWLDLVAIGTIADVAPLDGDNRALVRAGPRACSATRAPRPPRARRARQARRGVAAHRAKTSRSASRRASTRPVGSARRISRSSSCSRKTDADARRLAAEVERSPIERRALQERMIAEALAEIEREGSAERPAIVSGAKAGTPASSASSRAGSSDRYRQARRRHRPRRRRGPRLGARPAGFAAHDALSRVPDVSFASADIRRQPASRSPAIAARDAARRFEAARRAGAVPERDAWACAVAPSRRTTIRHASSAISSASSPAARGTPRHACRRTAACPRPRGPRRPPQARARRRRRPSHLAASASRWAHWRADARLADARCSARSGATHATAAATPSGKI